MNLYDQFTSNQNKGMIWQLLGNNGTFNNIPESKSPLVKMEFDRKVALIATAITDVDQLVGLNKRVIGEMVQNIGKYKAPNGVAPNGVAPNGVDNMSAGYNAADIAQQRQKAFENELKQKQNDFEKFNNKPVPSKIDFADKADEPLGSEMDKILAEQITLREKQLNIVLETQDKTAASKWLQISPPNDNISLKIGEDIKLEGTAVLSPRKKVNFTEPSSSSSSTTTTTSISDDFMSLLKKTPVQTDDMKEMLLEILDKQNKILDLLLKIEKN
jgi:hypothetical protein